MGFCERNSLAIWEWNADEIGKLGKMAHFAVGKRWTRSEKHRDSGKKTHEENKKEI